MLTLKSQRRAAIEDMRSLLSRLIEVNSQLAQSGEPEEHKCLVAATIRQLDAVIRLLEATGA